MNQCHALIISERPTSLNTKLWQNSRYIKRMCRLKEHLTWCFLVKFSPKVSKYLFRFYKVIQNDTPFCLIKKRLIIKTMHLSSLAGHTHSLHTVKRGLRSPPCPTICDWQFMLNCLMETLTHKDQTNCQWSVLAGVHEPTVAWALTTAPPVMTQNPGNSIIVRLIETDESTNVYNLSSMLCHVPITTWRVRKYIVLICTVWCPGIHADSHNTSGFILSMWWLTPCNCARVRSSFPHR